MVMQCPFFKRECSLKLYCEGGTIKFIDWQMRGEYVGKYCADIQNWKKCSLAKELENYYERKDKENEHCKRN